MPELLETIRNTADGHSMLDLLSDRQAQEYLQLSRQTLYSLRRRGKLRYSRVSGRIMYLREYLIEYVRKGERLDSPK